VRERIGKAEEEVELPAEVRTGQGPAAVAEVARRGICPSALQHPEAIRVAINQEHVDHAKMIGGAREIALFPPMTGG
jgi:molybdopterin synthase sulfur carrier subunit